MTDLAGLPPFWTKPSLSPPYSWYSWFGQFSLALGIKDNFNVSDILVEPGDVHDDPPPRPESRPDPESQRELDDRFRGDAVARRGVEEANAERRKKGPRIGMNWFFHEAEARTRSRLFLPWEMKAERNWCKFFHMRTSTDYHLENFSKTVSRF